MDSIRKQMEVMAREHLGLDDERRRREGALPAGPDLETRTKREPPGTCSLAC